jgi:hypothetical protein
MSKEFFEHIVDALMGFLPSERTDFGWRAGSRNLKVWFGSETREHYEVQLVGSSLEVGFHAEHSDVHRNEAALALLLEHEKSWRRRLRGDVEAGRYVGRRSSPWRRISECWDGDGLLEPETAIEAAERLATYIEAFEPIRASSPAPAGRRR